jgi:hypothetical protein
LVQALSGQRTVMDDAGFTLDAAALTTSTSLRVKSLAAAAVATAGTLDNARALDGGAPESILAGTTMESAIVIAVMAKAAKANAARGAADLYAFMTVS